MSKMKNSGIEWIGMIPEEWETSFMKYDCKKITDYTASGSFSSLDENVEYLDEPDYAMLIRTADLSKKREMNPIYINEHAYNFLKNSNLFGGEIILSNIGSVGEIFLYTPLYERSSLAPNSIMAISNYDSRYMFYYLLSPTVNNELKSIGGNAVQSKFNKTQLRQFKCLTPPLKEQQLIADFLDDKVGKVDEILIDLNNQVEILQKYKKSVITKAVTKGLNPEISMKDSGIEWIGEIPESWETKKIKYLVSSLTDGTHGTFDRVQSGKLLLSAKNVFEHGIVIGTNESEISEKDYKSIVANGFPKKGDVLLCCVGTVGRCTVYEYDEPIAFQRSVIFMRCNDLIIPEMMKYCMQTDVTFVQERLLINKSAQDGLYQGSVKELLLTFPKDKDIQKQIINYLDDKCAKIDELIKDKQNQIEKMEKYKKSLIYEYVTGKKRVKGV